MADQGGVRCAYFRHPTTLAVYRSKWPGQFELKVRKWVLYSFEVEFS
jgi:hypothetical protein